MKVSIATLSFFLGGALTVSAAGVSVAACSSDGGSGVPSSGDSGGAHDGTAQDGTAQMDGGMQGDSATGNDGGDMDAACKSVPSLHASDGGPGSIYCPFGPNDGGAIKCDPGQLCCINPKVGGTYPPSTCGASCPYADAGGATTLQCEDGITCAANGLGSICCGSGPAPANNAACGYYEEKGLKGGACEQGPVCASGEFQLCATQAECGDGGKTCTAFRAKGMQLGFCM